MTWAAPTPLTPDFRNRLGTSRYPLPKYTPSNSSNIR